MMIRTPQLGLEHIMEKHHPIPEAVQTYIWLGVSLVAPMGCLFQQRWRGLFLLAWIASTAMLMGLRELDLQVVVNPENIHVIGVPAEYAMHWRTRWLINPDVPLLVKLVWILLWTFVVGIVLVPFCMSSYPWTIAARTLDKPAWTLAGGFGLLGLAYLIDGGKPGQPFLFGLDFPTVEELFETAGVALFLVWTSIIAFGRPNLFIPEPTQAEA